MQRVEVTGTNIKRTEAEAAGSVQILTRDDIERTGQATALGILTSSSAISSDLNSASASSGSFATGASGASMRGLGKVATLVLVLVLVLVNGRRIASYGLSDGAQQNFTNLDTIASDAIERIEILKDGASAIYGSDAMAGVINIILRKDYVGAKIRVHYQAAQDFSDMRHRDVSGIVGYGDIDQRLSANFVSSYSNNSVSSPTYCATQKVATEYLATCDKVASNTTFDYNLAYSGIPHVKVNLYIDNLLNRGAPIQWRDGWSSQFRKVGFAASYTY